MGSLELVGWITVGIVLCALAIPWFLWGNSTVVAGLPVWLWWHVGWMGLASVVFRQFARRAWGLGIGIEPGPYPGPDSKQKSKPKPTGAELESERRGESP
ncbi:DUF3311 domain-containing protein [Natrialba asiatica]|uniref:DUF3311 domain-containing protein n=1 Tax=Natrialba asiatica (strain ATCC 700177 / DSM 12278 / JCM 9576 / FERM P-10747 / NBRC 102637 / 172P1) TaxID=29540 RepID=M0AXY5_NATA1|nr:DUF3311 domain-containing protein [Natrialba asiatica]ELZ03370.1 hypothetical protein C481_05225 [Natrialba asiatica DSM 12278]